MTRLPLVMSVFLLTHALPSCGHLEKRNVSRTPQLKALARFVSHDGGDRLHFSRFIILKDFSQSTSAGDTITVGYYLNKDKDQQFDTVLLNLDKPLGQTTMPDYFICPEFDAKVGIQEAKVEVIDVTCWKNCEMNNRDCKPLSFTRTSNQKNWFLIIPCGGTETEVSVSGVDNSFSLKLHLLSADCPPCIELTDMSDGSYSANMVACGLGGQVNFSLITTKRQN